MRRGWNGIACASGVDATDEDARLVIRKRAMRVGRFAHNLDSVDRLRQVFAWMPGSSRNLHVKGDIGCTFRNDHTGLVCIVENDAVANVPGGRIKSTCSS